ncbi:MAG: peptidoglycan-binding protein [Deltaproteobacteria bacterium]|nr:peptidoglycan-binding protein [Deltaproteobacteria bacterium]
MDVFIRLFGEKNWDLKLPLHVRGIRIDEDAIDGAEPARVTATDAPPPRLLSLKSPALTGPDVKALQSALIAAGATISADGVFGPNTDKAVRDFQRSKGLVVDGIVGPTTRTYLGM